MKAFLCFFILLTVSVKGFCVDPVLPWLKVNKLKVSKIIANGSTGTVGQVLTTDGAGGLSWSAAGGSSGWTDGGTMVSLTTPTDSVTMSNVVLTSTAPVLSLWNTNETDVNLGRETVLNFYGERSTGEVDLLTQFKSVHVGTGTNAAASVLLKVNDGNDVTPSVQYAFGASTFSCPVSFFVASKNAIGVSSNDMKINDGDANSTLSLYGGGYQRVHITSTGNVGLNKASPLKVLDVGGSQRIIGTATSVLTGTIDPEASTSVVGVNTLFTTELIVGDRITVTGETRYVTSITDNTHLTVNAAFSDNANDTSPDKLESELAVFNSSGSLNFMVDNRGYVGVGSVPSSGGYDRVFRVAGNSEVDGLLYVDNIAIQSSGEIIYSGNGTLNIGDGSDDLINLLIGSGDSLIISNSSDARLFSIDEATGNAKFTTGLKSYNVDSVGVDGIVTHGQTVAWDTDASDDMLKADMADSLANYVLDTEVDTVWESLNWFLDSPVSALSDTLWLFLNTTGKSLTITESNIQSDLENAAVTILECDEGGGSVQSVDALTASTAGANFYYNSDTSPAHATIETRHRLGLPRPASNADGISIHVRYYYLRGL